MMLAKHPITGKDIRIMQTDASIWREKKTLQFVKEGGSYVNDTVSTDPTLGASLCIILDQQSPSKLVEFSKSHRLLFVSKVILQKMSIQEFKALRIENIVCLEELDQVYGHIGESWLGTVEDAVVMIAHLLGYRQISGLGVGSLEKDVKERASSAGIALVNEPPFKLWWVTQYYVPGQSKRRREIQKCLEVNCSSRLISKVLLLNEKEEDLSGLKLANKPEQKIIGHRLTYKDVFEQIREMPDDVVVAFANADICIDDDTWPLLWSVNLENVFLALLRYDVPDSGNVREAQIFGPRADSQDTWVVRAADVKKRGADAWRNFDFTFGRMGCDNAVAVEVLRQKFTVVNPAYSLRTWHYHNSGIRNYRPEDVLEKPIFHYVTPSGFHDMKPILKIVGGAAGQKYLSLKNCFQTSGGLAYDANSLYIGPAARAQKLWEKAQLNSLTPSVRCKRGLIVPVGDDGDVFRGSRECYVLGFLSRILRLWKSVGPGEFFCPEGQQFTDMLGVFKWTGLGPKQLPLIKWEPGIRVFCEEAAAFLPEESEEIGGEEMEALRDAVRGWVPAIRGSGNEGNRMRIVIVEDGKVLTAKKTRELEDVLERAWDIRVVFTGRTSAERIVESLVGAWGVICSGSDDATESWGWNWALPPGAMVFAVDDPKAGKPKEKATACRHVSTVAGLEHRQVSMDEVLEEVWREGQLLQGSGFGLGSAVDLPTIWLPRRDLEGYFGHPGDSFREMVRLWAAAGYCRAKEHLTATMVWWNQVGAEGILLYDRPNHDWRLAAPLPEKEWRGALFGNPKPPATAATAGASKTSPWFFWPRRPQLVEELVAAGLPEKPWEDRKQTLVFYGKVENKVQEKRRINSADWETACDKEGGWLLVKGADEKYPFTQKQYLEKLAESKFGLCLAGYGYKCHREIECMAMGTVPICAPDVDMSSYAVPPVEGVHYLRCSGPVEARAAAESMGAEKWKEMSAACRAWWAENCSCEGSFKLTKKLVEGI
jgi:hypothetical protein